MSRSLSALPCSRRRIIALWQRLTSGAPSADTVPRNVPPALAIVTAGSVEDCFCAVGLGGILRVDGYECVAALNFSFETFGFVLGDAHAD